MSTRAARTALAVAASTTALVCALSVGVPAASASTGSGGGESNVCSAAGLPSTTKTVGVTGVFHVTVFTCADATATGFQQCPSKTIAVPNIFHTTVFYCVPTQLGVSFSSAGLDQTVTVAGVGEVSIGFG